MRDICGQMSRSDWKKEHNSNKVFSVMTNMPMKDDSSYFMVDSLSFEMKMYDYDNYLQPFNLIRLMWIIARIKFVIIEYWSVNLIFNVMPFHECMSLFTINYFNFFSNLSLNGVWKKFPQIAFLLNGLPFSLLLQYYLFIIDDKQESCNLFIFLFVWNQ